MQGKALVVDLTSKTTTEQEIPQKYFEQYIGGRGLGTRLLHDHIDPKIDPLGVENVLIFVVGPLNATRAFYSSKSVLVTKSPQSGTCLYTISSGAFCHNLAKCGYAALIIKGKAEHPTYLVVQDKTVSFKNAAPIWGMSTGDADFFIAKKLPAQTSIAVIGPAGENLVKYACIATEGRQRNVFGRGGAGAVMGSKNLKAVAVLGTGDVAIADPAALHAAQRLVLKRLAEAADYKTAMRKYGTRGVLVHYNAGGILPTRQWHSGQYKDVQKFSPEVIEKDWIIGNESCADYCPNPCYHWTTVKDGEYAGATAFGPEYETIYAFGTNLENDRFDSIIAADDYCDLMGLDTMSAGLTIGWATECYERGILTKEDTDGIDMRYGNHQMLLELIRKIAYREGKIGALLAEGSQRAAATIGQGSDAWAMTSKGLEFGGYECRGSWGQAIQFAFSSRGGCHHDLGTPARFELGTPEATQVEGRGAFVKARAASRIAFDCSVLCAFGQPIGSDAVAALLAAVTGHPFDVPMLDEIGERGVNIERLFNSKAGFGRADDRLPSKLLEEPLPDGPNRGLVVPLEALKDDFYAACGWDPETGFPKAETLQRLGIEVRP